MPRLGRVLARLFLALKPLPAHLVPTSIRQPTHEQTEKNKIKMSTYLAFQIERGSVRIRALIPQLGRKRPQRSKHALALSADRRDDARAKFLWRVGLRRKHGGVVVDARIDEERAARARVVVAGAERVDATGLDVDARDLGFVMSCEYGELDGAAPGVRREDGADVFFARAAFFREKKMKASTTRAQILMSDVFVGCVKV